MEVMVVGLLRKVNIYTQKHTKWFYWCRWWSLRQGQIELNYCLCVWSVLQRGLEFGQSAEYLQDSRRGSMRPAACSVDWRVWRKLKVLLQDLKSAEDQGRAQISFCFSASVFFLWLIWSRCSPVSLTSDVMNVERAPLASDLQLLVTVQKEPAGAGLYWCTLRSAESFLSAVQTNTIIQTVKHYCSRIWLLLFLKSN